jgi:TRAP-type transport system small permease protein
MLERVERHLARALDGVAIGLMATLVLVITWSVVGRQVVRISVPWAEEVGSGLLAWMVALGAAAAWSRRGHIAIDVLPRHLGPRARRTLLTAIELASILLFAVALAGAWSMMFVSAHNRTTALGISYTWLYLALVVGLGAMILFSLLHLARLLAGREPGPKPEEDAWSISSSS